MMRIPVRQAFKLWHWGELDYSKKQAQGISFEGRLFSTSVYPNAWRSICKYGNSPLHSSVETLYLIDSNAIFYSTAYPAKRLRQAIQEWGIGQGLLENALIYRVTESDDELGIDCQTFYRTAAEADSNANDPEQIDTLSLVICSAKLNHINGFPAIAVVGESYALIEWAKQFQGLDGIYWNDTLRPGLMAPRAGLFEVPKLVQENPVSLPDDAVLKTSVSKILWLDPHADFNAAFTEKEIAPKEVLVRL